PPPPPASASRDRAASFSAASRIAFASASLAWTCWSSYLALFQRSTAASNWDWSAASRCLADSTCCWVGAAVELMAAETTKAGTTRNAATTSRVHFRHVPLIVLLGPDTPKARYGPRAFSRLTLPIGTGGRQT